MITVIIVDHEEFDEARTDAAGWVGPIHSSLDEVRNLTVINAKTGHTSVYRNEELDQ